MRILHLSDFHLRGDGGLSFRVVDTLECLRVVAEHLKTLVQKPDALVITGDLADSGDAHAYSLLHEALAPLSLPVYAVPGNHDRRYRMRELLGNWCPADASVAPYLCYAVEDGPVRLVMLDTMQPGSHSGHCPEAVAGWLERTLAARPGVPTLLFMHHPPFVTGMGAMDEPFENVGRLADILSRSPWVLRAYAPPHRDPVGGLHRVDLPRRVHADRSRSFPRGRRHLPHGNPRLSAAPLGRQRPEQPYLPDSVFAHVLWSSPLCRLREPR